MASTIAHNTVFPIPKGGSQAGKKQSKHRDEDPKYLAWIRTLPCIRTLVIGNEVEAHHVNDYLFRKGRKNEDRRTVPICAHWHRLDKNSVTYASRRFWNDMGINPFELMDDLNRAYDAGELYMGILIIMNHRERGLERLKKGDVIFDEKLKAEEV